MEHSDSQTFPGYPAWVLMLGVVLVASNLRASITAVGPVAAEIRADTGISNTLTGLLTTLPLLAFALVSPLASKFARRFGLEQSLFLALLVLTGGIILRSTPSVAALFTGTALLGMGIAVCNVLLPGLIKKEFPEKVGLMTGLFTVCMGTFAAIASGLSIPLADGLGLGWRGMLASWAVLSALSIAAWLPQLKLPHLKNSRDDQKLRRGQSSYLWRSALAWQVTFFMGLQSFTFYAIIAWMPQILKQWGLTGAAAGFMLSLLQFVSLPASFLAPILATRSANQRGIVVACSLLLLTGFSGLLLEHTLFLPVWMVLIGLGSGASFSLALTLFVLRSRKASQAAELSGMAQSLGYLFAAVGPTLIGFLHDLTGGWSVPLFLLMGISILLLAAGLGAGRSGYVSMAEKEESLGVNL